MLTALAQVLRLNQGESPFYSQWGIPARSAVITQVFPDFAVAYTQQAFAPQFAALMINKRADPTPTYDIFITTKLGVQLNVKVPIPT
jgi:hypothetical protein